MQPNIITPPPAQQTLQTLQDLLAMVRNIDWAEKYVDSLAKAAADLNAAQAKLAAENRKAEKLASTTQAKLDELEVKAADVKTKATNLEQTAVAVEEGRRNLQTAYDTYNREVKAHEATVAQWSMERERRENELDAAIAQAKRDQADAARLRDELATKLDAMRALAGS